MTGTIGLLVAGPRLRGTSGEQWVSLVLAWANLAFGTASTISALVPFSARHSLPLQICDLAWVVVAWALLTRAALPLALTYYWGLTLAVQALVQPTLTEGFPDPAFFVFWGKHVLIVWGAVYLCLALRVGPDWATYRRAVVCTLGWLVVVLCANGVFDANYGYVSAKPSEATVLDVLGPWPVYLVAESAIVLAGWALITLPWSGRRVRR